MKLRPFITSVLACVVALSVLFASPALGQHTRLVFCTDQGIWVPATDRQMVRVTIGNPLPAAPAEDRQLNAFVIEFDRPVDPVTIEPGKTFTFTLDPREAGILVDPRSGLRHVNVSFRATVQVEEAQSAPRPSTTIEILDRTTGAVASSHAYPGFSGGVYVAAGDLD